MDEHLFLMGQRVITPVDEGEVADAAGDKIIVKLDTSLTQAFPPDELTDNNGVK